MAHTWLSRCPEATALTLANDEDDAAPVGSFPVGQRRGARPVHLEQLGDVRASRLRALDLREFATARQLDALTPSELLTLIVGDHREARESRPEVGVRS